MSISPVKTPSFPELKMDGNPLANTIGFIRDRNVVVLHAKGNVRAFYINSLFENNDFQNQSPKELLADKRVVYIDCDEFPGLLDDSEWAWYIKNEIKEVKEVQPESKLASTVVRLSAVSNKVLFKI